MKKRNILLILLLVLSFTLTGCAEKPEAVIDDFMKEVKDFNLEAAGKFVAGNEGEAGFQEAFEDDLPDSFLNYMKDKAGKIEYKIEETKVNGDKGVSTVKFKYVDGIELLTNTMLQFVEESFGIILEDGDISNEKADEILESIFNNNVDKVEDRFAEKTLDINLIKKDGKWYIDNIEDDLLDVMLANFVSTFDSLDDLEEIEDEGLELENAEIVELSMDETMELATIDVKVNSIKEVDKLEGDFGQAEPVDGAKFLVLDLDIKNTTKESMEIWGDRFQIIDSKERIYETYEDTIGSIDNYMDARTIGAGLTENGVFIYEVPEDASKFKLMTIHGDTDEVILMELK